MSAQPIALWLANKLEDLPADGHWLTVNNAAAELRRLHSVNAELLEALKLADLTLSGANMNRSLVEKKVRAAIAKATGETE